jgi:hypothetical protein
MGEVSGVEFFAAASDVVEFAKGGLLGGGFRVIFVHIQVSVI